MAKDFSQDKSIQTLFEAVLSLNNLEECMAFFQDLCTVAELKSMAQRLQVASLLREERTYAEITAETGVSAATISRVSKALDYGEDGYRFILDRLAEHNK